MPFIDYKGNQHIHLGCTICPIGEHLYERKWQLSGTGFYIHPEGIALSASHNFQKRGTEISLPDSLSNKFHFESINTPAFFRLFPQSGNKISIEISKIHKVIFFPKNDIAIVLASTGKNPPKRLDLTSQIPEKGNTIYAYSYPNMVGNTDNISGKLAIKPTEFEGVVTNLYLEGRDRSLLPGPCIEAQMKAPGGTSGGPVFNHNGQVFGVISTSFSGTPPITYITPIYTILEMKFKVDTNNGIRDMTLSQLAKMNLISLIE